MMISTKGRYALRIMADVAQHDGEMPVSVREIAQRQDISGKYMEQIISVLTRSGLLRSIRGAQGGYQLAKSPDSYTLGEILRLTEGSLAPILCAEQEPADCARSEDCALRPVWQGLYRTVCAYLDGITLQTLLDRQAERRTDDYTI